MYLNFYLENKQSLKKDEIRETGSLRSKTVNVVDKKRTDGTKAIGLVRIE